jgi:NTP pyrophosphatase (non-canonical NTP hydrolase)
MTPTCTARMLARRTGDDVDANVYQRLAMRTANPALDVSQQLLNGALGLCGEAGEVADTLKKSLFQGHELDRDVVLKELGDVLWYVAQLCEALGLNMATVMESNVEKLRRRYPGGFSSADSVSRVDE